MSRLIIAAMLVVGAVCWSSAAEGEQRESAQVEALKEQIKELEYFTGPDHPERLRLNGQLQRARLTHVVSVGSEIEVREFMTEIRNELASLRKRMEQLERSKNIDGVSLGVDPEDGEAIIQLARRFHPKYNLQLVQRNGTLFVRGETAAIEFIKQTTLFLDGSASENDGSNQRDPFN